jgi:hypothetical protein
MLSLIQIPLHIAVVFTRGEKIPFQPLFKNIGEKPAFQKGWFSARLVFRKAGFQKGKLSERLFFSHIFTDIQGSGLRSWAVIQQISRSQQ